MKPFLLFWVISATIAAYFPAGPQDGTSLDDLAASAQARGEFGEAERLYRRILSIRWGGPSGSARVDAAQILDDFAAVLSLGHFRGPGFEQALKKFKQEIGTAPLNKDAYVPMRDGLLSTTLVAEAESLMLSAVESFPDSRQIRYHLAELYATSENFEKALQVFQQAVPLKGASDAEADRVQRSLVDRRIGDMNTLLVRFDDAVAAYQRSLEINPDNTEAHLGLADTYLRRDLAPEALAQYGRMAEAQSTNATARYGLAQAYLRLGRFAESAAAAQAALQIDPLNQKSRYLLATALIRAGLKEQGQKVLDDYERREAAAEAEKKRRLDIDEVDRTASAAMMAGRREEAIVLFRDGIRAHPGAAVLYLKLGLAQSELGRHRDAAGTFQAMIERGMDDFLVYRNLAREYELLGDAESSLKYRVVYLQKYDSALKARL